MLKHLPKLFYVVLAIGAYLVVHQLQVWLVSAGDDARLYAAIAFWAQFILPLCFLAAALFSGRGQTVREVTVSKPAKRRPHRLQTGVVEEPVIKVDPFRRMSREEFDQLIGEFFTRNGFSIEPAPPELGDAVDYSLNKNSKIYLAQLKYWREPRLDLSVVREQYTIMQVAKAHGIYVVCSGEFSYKAIQFAEDKSVSLIDGLKLRRLLKKPQALVTDYPVGDRGKAPACPLCGEEMVIKTGSRGAEIGKRYWSCGDARRCGGRILIRH